MRDAVWRNHLTFREEATSSGQNIDKQEALFLSLILWLAADEKRPLVRPGIPALVKNMVFTPFGRSWRWRKVLWYKERCRNSRQDVKAGASPTGCCAKRKATRRCEQIQGLRAASAQNADICEVPAAKPPAE